MIAAAVGTSPVLDIEGLVLPISEAAPCGGDPRSDPSPTSVYQALKDARYAAADAERGLERGFAEEGDAKKADETSKKSWSLILAEGPPLIKSVAKDLEVAAWVTEAALRAHRLAGLRDGLRCTAELVDRYWDQDFPLPDEDGLETHLAPLAGLSGGDIEGRLITPLKKVPLTKATIRRRSPSGNTSAQRTRQAARPRAALRWPPSRRRCGAARRNMSAA